jgi:hypothetical protein
VGVDENIAVYTAPPTAPTIPYAIAYGTGPFTYTYSYYASGV